MITGTHQSLSLISLTCPTMRETFDRSIVKADDFTMRRLHPEMHNRSLLLTARLSGERTTLRSKIHLARSRGFYCFSTSMRRSTPLNLTRRGPIEARKERSKDRDSGATTLVSQSRSPVFPQFAFTRRSKTTRQENVISWLSFLSVPGYLPPSVFHCRHQSYPGL